MERLTIFHSFFKPKMMCRLWMISGLTLAFILSEPSLFAQEKLPSLLLEVEKKYQKAGSLEAHFTQEGQNPQGLQKKKTSSGKLFIRFPSKLRWDTEKPDPQLLITDGKTFWYYTPPFDPEEPGQLIQKKASQVESELAHELLAGSFSSVKGAEISQKSKNQFLITPRRGRAGNVQKAQIEINPQKLMIEKITLFHVGGHRSEISLTHIELGKNLSEDLFHFKVPPGTDIIQDP